MARANRKTENRQASAEDKEQLKRIARKMLDHLEHSVDRIDEAEEAQAHDKLFGAKNSLVAALVTLSDLMADLGDIEPEQAEEIAEDEVKQEEKIERSRIKIGDKDVALIKGFIARQKEYRATRLRLGIAENSIPPPLPETLTIRGGDP